jgi:hypothetical protein
VNKPQPLKQPKSPEQYADRADDKERYLFHVAFNPL